MLHVVLAHFLLPGPPRLPGTVLASGVQQSCQAVTIRYNFNCVGHATKCWRHCLTCMLTLLHTVYPANACASNGAGASAQAASWPVCQRRGNTMAKKAIRTKAAKNAASITPVAAPATTPVAAPATTPVAGAKLTRRNTTPSNAVLMPTAKPVRIRSAHVLAAWQAVLQCCGSKGATAATLAALPVFSGPHAAALVNGPGYVSYMQRRGYLAIKAN